MNPSFVLFGIACAGYGAIVADYILTVEGLAKGLIEANPISKWLFSKIGQPATAFVSACVFTVGIGVFATINLSYGIAFTSAFTAAGIINVVRDLVKLKKL